jgi:UDP-glucose 4-epimerase
MLDKTLLITGGTGSFGNAVLRRFLKTDFFSEIRIFSRDEKKQDERTKGRGLRANDRGRRTED